MSRYRPPHNHKGFGLKGLAFGSRLLSSSGHADKAPSKQRQLYDTQIAPLLSSGLEQNAEPILLLLAQGTNPLPEVHRDLGRICEARGHLKEAEKWYRRWMSCLPSTLDQRLAQARKAEQMLMPQLALERYLNVLELQEFHPEALCRATELLVQGKRFEEALPFLSRRFEIESPTIELWQLSSRCAFETGDMDRAAECAAKSLLQRTEQPVQLAIQARCFQSEGKVNAALAFTEQAIQLAHDSLEWGLVNRIVAPILFSHGLFEHCDAALTCALEAEPDRPELHILRAKLLLSQWRLFEGFQEYLWRHAGGSVNMDVTHFPQSKGQQIALVCEGTLGDTLLFSRYAHWLRSSQGLNVSMYVQVPLLTLLTQCLGEFISVKAHYQLRHLPSEVPVVPMLSAPAMYGTCQEHTELGVPHLHADSDLICHWRRRLSLQTGDRLIGLNWHGSPLHALSENYSSDIPLEQLKPLASLPHIRLLSLQKGVGSEQLDSCSFSTSFVADQQAVTDEVRLEHIAALMSLCEWVVSDDSGPAHLASNLGISTIVLLPYRCNWRWGASGSHHPWYPSVHLLRQRNDDTWYSLAQKAASLIES